MKKLRIPTREEWGDLKADPEVRYAYKLFGGKSVDEVMDLFTIHPIERCAELRYSSIAVFRYYVQCFTKHLLSPESKGASDVASCFLHLVHDKLKKDQEMAVVYPELRDAVSKVAEKQDFYEADTNIYGSFADLRSDIEHAYQAKAT